MKKYRSVFVSDLHLGARGNQASCFFDFIRNIECENLYLVGDIIDGWRLRRKFYWPQSHSDIIQKILRMARKGTNIVYITGNHDEFLRNFVPKKLGKNLKIVNECYYHTQSGKKLLIIHGDQFDGVVRLHPWIYMLGDYAYMFVMKINYLFNVFRRKFGMGYWSLSSFAKKKVKSAVKYISNYEQTMIKYAIERNCDGILCGHIHQPDLETINNIIYANCGDWMETCSAILEDMDGNFHLYIHHSDFSSLKKVST